VCGVASSQALHGAGLQQLSCSPCLQPGLPRCGGCSSNRFAVAKPSLTSMGGLLLGGRAAAMVEAYKGDLLNKSYYPTSADASNSTKRWYVIDAEGQTLGRLATLAATYIRCVAG
jgi:hypothetical protein